MDHLDGAAPSPSRNPPQLGLFAPPHPLAAELRALDPDRITPLDALRLIGEWKRRLTEG